MTLNKTVTFIEAFQQCRTELDWNIRNTNITSFVNKDGNTIDIIKNNTQIVKTILMTACEHFFTAAGADSKTRAKQNNTMISVCLTKALTADAQARLLTYQRITLLTTLSALHSCTR